MISIHLRVSLLMTLFLFSLFPIPVYGQLPVSWPRGIGVGIAWQQGADAAAHAVETLQPAYWLDWRWDGSDDDRYMPMVFGMTRDGWSEAALARSQGDSRIWLLGNEPDWGHTYTSPRDAAAMARWWAANTDAPWACCGVIVTLTGDHWSAWLQHYLLFGGPPPAYWHVHIFNGTPNNWHAHVERFRAWARSRGVERPIIVSETAYPHGSAEYNALLVKAIRQALARDPALHAVLWYSARDVWGLWPGTDLLDADGALTVVGRAFVGEGPVLRLSFLYLPVTLHMRERGNGYVNQVHQGYGGSFRRELIN